MKTKNEKENEIIEWLQKQHEFTSMPKTNSNSLFYHVSERTYAMLIHRFLEQLEPEEEVYVECDQLDRDLSAFHIDDVDEKQEIFLKKSPPPQQPSEGEIEKIIYSHLYPYTDTRQRKKLAKAIKELLNR